MGEVESTYGDGEGRGREIGGREEEKGKQREMSSCSS